MRGPNHRALQARERTKLAQQEKEMMKEKLKEDLRWKDEYTESKLQKKEDQALKQMEKLKKKQELKRLEEEEVATAKSKITKPAPIKLARAEIQTRALKALEEARKKATKEQAPDEICDFNINHMLAGEAREAMLAGQEYIAGNIDDFLRTIEKQKKSLFTAYEEEWFVRLKEEFPSLKRSQLKEKIWKQWLKAPENPINRIDADKNICD